jgi:hypothetical protein
MKVNEDKPYFCPALTGEEACFTAGEIIEEMKALEIKEITVFVAAKEPGESYCWYYKSVLDFAGGNPCGKNCGRYKVKQGKKRLCKYKTPCYTPGDKYTLKVNGEIIKEKEI